MGPLRHVWDWLRWINTFVLDSGILKWSCHEPDGRWLRALIHSSSGWSPSEFGATHKQYQKRASQLAAMAFHGSPKIMASCTQPYFLFYILFPDASTHKHTHAPTQTSNCPWWFKGRQSVVQSLNCCFWGHLPWPQTKQVLRNEAQKQIEITLMNLAVLQANRGEV